VPQTSPPPQETLHVTSPQSTLQQSTLPQATPPRPVPLKEAIALLRAARRVLRVCADQSASVSTSTYDGLSIASAGGVDYAGSEKKSSESLSSSFATVVGRERETDEIFDFLRARLSPSLMSTATAHFASTHATNVLYLCGVPGSGKTLSVTAAVKRFRDYAR
jgi:chromosomal replication initiation ATPase DnaA